MADYVRRDEFEALRARVDARVDTIFSLILVDMGKLYVHAKQCCAWACDRLGFAKFLMPILSQKKKKSENGGSGSSSSVEYRYAHRQ